MKKLLFVFIAIIAFSAVPIFCDNAYLLGLAVTLLLSIATASAWNIVGGYAGQPSLGNAAYFGAGAYTTLLLLTKFDINPVLGAFVGLIVSLVLAGITGRLVFRLTGHYFALASIAFTWIVSFYTEHASSVTNGSEGINAASALSKYTFGLADLSSKVPFYYLSLSLVVIVLTTTYAIQRSKLGYCLQAIRENQDAACSLGINLPFYKNSALLISAGFTSVAGSIFAVYIRFIDVQSTLSLSLSIEMILIAIIGGVGTVFGPALGALVLIPVAEILRSNILSQALIDYGLVDANGSIGIFLKDNLAHAHVLIYGVVTVVVILYSPSGIIGVVKRLGRKS